MSEAPKQDPPAAKAKESHPKPHTSSDKPHHLKISRMNLSQVDAALEKAMKDMGGLHSHYARALAGRKEALTAHEDQSLRHAA